MNKKPTIMGPWALGIVFLGPLLLTLQNTTLLSMVLNITMIPSLSSARGLKGMIFQQRRSTDFTSDVKGDQPILGYGVNTFGK